ncbi:MAG: IS1634 family transposase [Phycisphaerae bacterium]
MYIDKVPNRKSRPTTLLRSGRREGDKVHLQTLANISHWPEAKIEALRRVLRNEPVGLVGSPECLTITSGLPHGHVAAVLGTLRKLGLDQIISSKRCRQRDIILALIAARILFPTSKLGSTRHWSQCTLGSELGVLDVEPDELYASLDWLLHRQNRIEKKLAEIHLVEGGSVLYDLSSSYYCGEHCELAKFGHSRDGKKGWPIIVYGLLANKQGCPVAVQVYAGHTADPKTMMDQVEKVRRGFNLQRVVMVGDRGSLTSTNIDKIKEYPGVGWIGALRGESIGKLVREGILNRSLFDKQYLAEIQSPDYPGERLIACWNPLLAEKRVRTRESLLLATEEKLKPLQQQALRTRDKGKPWTDAQIGLRVGRVLNKHKMAKHFIITVKDANFSYARNTESIEAEAKLDGLYCIRTSEAQEAWPAPDVVRGYKDLGNVEKAFRCLKQVDLKVRPIFLRKTDHVKAHILLCVLAYYVEWHMRQKLSELLYADEEIQVNRSTRDPVLPAQASASAKEKKNTHRNGQGLPVQSFRSLLEALATQSRNVCRMTGDDDNGPTATLLAMPTVLQRRAFELLECTQ